MDLFEALKDNFFSKNRSECPQTNLLEKYSYGKLKRKEKEKMEIHLRLCPDCVNKLQYIRRFGQATHAPAKVPSHLHHKSKKILEKELGILDPSKKISIYWNKAKNKIARVIEDMVIPLQLEYQQQSVRKSGKESTKYGYDFPCSVKFDTNMGEIHLIINRGNRDGYLTLEFSADSLIKEANASIRVCLYQTGGRNCEVPLDIGSRAIFPGIKEGTYRLEFRQGEKLLDSIEFTLTSDSDKDFS